MSVIEQIRVEHPVSAKIHRLSTASAKRVIEPDTDLPGHIGPGQILPDDLLSVAGLDLDLTDEQKAKLSREEVGSITTAGVIFEAVLEAGFALQITRAHDLTDPRITFLLHEIGEETRHQRMFIRMLEDLRPTAVHPLDKWLAPGDPALRPRAVHPAAGAALHARARRRGDPRPHPEEGGRAPRHRPVHPAGEPVPPPGGGPAPVLRPGRAARGVGRRPGAIDRLPRPPGRPARHRRHVRHARAPRCVRDRRPARLGHLEGRPGLRASASRCATRPPGRSCGRSSTPAR